MPNQQICGICGTSKPIAEFRRSGTHIDPTCIVCKRNHQKGKKTLIERPSRVIEPQQNAETQEPLHVIEPQDPLKNIDLDDYSVWEEDAGRGLTDDEKIEIKHNVNRLGSVLLKILEREI